MSTRHEIRFQGGKDRDKEGSGNQWVTQVAPSRSMEFRVTQSHRRA